MKEIKKILKIKAIIKAYYQSFLIIISKNLDKPFNKPTSITITITTNCNSHCRHCHLWKSKPEKQLSLDQGKNIIDKLYDWLGCFYLFFTGGEPFINQDLPEIIKYSQNKGIICHVNSNAILINKNLADKIIDSKLDSISLSLDGAKESTNNQIRGVPTAYQRVIKATKFLHSGPNIYFNTVIMKPNINELILLIKLSQKQKTNGINFQCLLPTLSSQDGIKEMKQGLLWPKYKDVKSQIQKIMKLDKSKKYNLLADKNYLQKIINYYHNPISANKNTICAAGINNFIIDRKGNVRLCFDMPPIGNLFKSSVKEIWLNPKSQEQRKNIRKCQKLCKITNCNKIDIHRQIKVDSQTL